MKYKVISARLNGSDPGDEVDDSALEGVNVKALVAGGHLKPTPTPTKKDK
jgi:hypothetical protein